jgi:histidinol phosphatase-like PHP family hydrolase
MAIEDAPDTNSLIAGLLRDMAFSQKATQSRWGYKRAASTVMQLDAPIDTYLDDSGALKKIPNIGPASTRIIMEGLQLGSSPIVDQAIEASGQRADILRRRGLRSHFLSRSRALAAMTLQRVNVPRLEDIRCDLQMHSDWSDGSQTLAEIIETGLARGYTHSAVTDHSYGLPIAGGLSMERVARQHQEIDALNARYRSKFRLLKGIEANIRADGSLDMTQEELALMEIVVAAPHSALRSTADQTARMIAAVNTPGVHILGHPRGRMYGSRTGVLADWDQVFEAAARAGVAIEIDGDPSRQDLDYTLAGRAVKSGCLFALDSDAHATDQWWYAETALAHARLAGVPRERVINCWPLARLLDWAGRRSRAAA